MPRSRPLIGITVDNIKNDRASGLYEARIDYAECVKRAGGVPLLLPHEEALAEEYADLCDGLLLSGGADPRLDQFPEHPPVSETAMVRPMDETRQRFELALLRETDRLHGKGIARPVLGVCLGMQLMSLFRGGTLNPSLMETDPGIAPDHVNDTRHQVQVVEIDSPLFRDQPKDELSVVSHHRQVITDPGDLRPVAVAPDGVLEAVDDPERPFWAAVQWHPERNRRAEAAGLNQGVIERLVRAAAMAS